VNAEVWLAYCLACIVISISPGAGAVNTMSNGLQFGVRNSLPAIFGLQLGYAAQFIIVGVGLGTLLASSTTLFEIIKWLGVLYLVGLGIQKWRQPLLRIQKDSSIGLDNSRRFWQATFVNLTNPKATVFLVALLPQFLDLNKPQIIQFSLMAVTGLGVDIIVMLGYATLATNIARWMKTEVHQRRLNRIFGTLFVVAAALMASYQR
jgi:homoserine/homoserine lactone efflux protein